MKQTCSPIPISLTASEGVVLIDGVELLLEGRLAPFTKGRLETVLAKLNLAVHGIKPKLTKQHEAYLKEYYGIWEDYYMGSCPTGEARDRALASLAKQYPNEEPPTNG
jgi:hypothetical protein